MARPQPKPKIPPPGNHKIKKRRSKRKKNPAAMTTALVIGAGVAAAGAGYYAYKKIRKRKMLPSVALADVMSEGTTVGDVPFIVGDVQQPILLRSTAQTLPSDYEYEKVPDLRIAYPGPPPLPFAGVSFGIQPVMGQLLDNTIRLFEADGEIVTVEAPAKAISYLVTDLAPYSAQLAYELALLEVATHEVDWSDATARDNSIRKIVMKIAPKMDWSQGLSPYTYGSAPYKVWSGVQLLGTVANQSYYNKLVLKGEV